MSEIDRMAVENARWHKAEAYRLRAIMAEAVKQDPVTCRKWIMDALDMDALDTEQGQSNPSGGEER